VKPIYATILLVFVAVSLPAQELVVLAKGVLKEGEAVELTGDDVRLRSGPSLKHRVLSLVNAGTRATIIERSDDIAAIDGKKNYWYRIRLTAEESPTGEQTSGWIFGWYLGKPKEKNAGEMGEGDRAYVSGDDVRLRSGPSLDHRILGVLSRNTRVLVLDRGEEAASIGGRTDHWYNIRLEDGSKEGWMFGSFLTRRETEKLTVTTTPEAEEAPVKESPDLEEGAGDAAAGDGSALTDTVSFLQEGMISPIGQSLVTSGDLNGNGIWEILFVGRSERKTSWELTAYEEGPDGGFVKSYGGRIRARDIRRINALDIGSPGFLAVSDDRYTTLYRYDKNRGEMIYARRLNSPVVAAGNLDGKSTYIVHLEQSRRREHDDTATYRVTANRIEADGRRLRTFESISYDYPLPVKRIVTADLNGNGRDEIVCEIGGTDRGGGLVVLTLTDDGLERIVNSGVVTYNDNPFVGMWGVEDGQDRSKLVLYTSNPDKTDDLGTELGFLTLSMGEGTLDVRSFVPVNKMLDDVNSRRLVLHFPEEGREKSTDARNAEETAEGSHSAPFLFLDYVSNEGYLVKRPILPF
jgi:uncharacterized protein YgiM (DUF1202 family)